MVDNTQVNTGTGDIVRDIDRSGVKTQVVQLDVGGASSESLVSATNPIPVQISDGIDTVDITNARELRVYLEGTELFYDAFETGIDTVAKWNPPVAFGGGIVAAWSAGSATLGSGTASTGFSYLQTQNAFQPQPPGFVEVFFSIKVPSSIPANTYAFWGTATPTPFAATSFYEGIGFELTGGKLYIASFAGGSRTVIQDLSSSGNNKQPTDGNTHIFYQWFRGDNMYWSIDTLGNVVASQATGVNGPNVNTQPIIVYASAVSGTPASNLSVQINAIWAADSARNSQSISDGVLPWRKATVKSAGTPVTATDTALVVTISPNSPVIVQQAAGGVQVIDPNNRIQAMLIQQELFSIQAIRSDGFVPIETPSFLIGG